MSSPDPSRFDVVVVGGGASGALVATHLLGDGACPHTVALVEARPAMAEGVAYSTRHPEHLLNVRAAGMSAFGDSPWDFVRFLEGLPEHAGQEPATLGARFMPRMVYARYLAALAGGRPGLERLSRITDAAVDVVPLEDGFEVVLASGGRLRARAVVLAVGNRPARLPVADGGAASGMAVVEAWDYAGVAAIPPDADVCILGAGLSMVDVVLGLCANGHRGRITSLSRRGLVPLPHAEPAPPSDVEIAGLLDEPDLRARLRAVRRVVAREQAQGRPWQAVMDALRPHVQALWTSLDAAGQRRFLRHLVRHWDVHRHRIAPEVARQLDAATASGQLRRLAGRLVVVDGGPRPGITWRPRGRDGLERFEADVLVNALGVDKRIDVGDGLLARLCGRGLLRPGPHRIGAATAADGVPLGADGAPVPGLWTLGALRVGDLWESIAMPELRGQALDVAGAVRAHLDATGP
ncbi:MULTISPECIES: FAD/NAD(P)-binding protein [unclassified Luteimonas]